MKTELNDLLNYNYNQQEFCCSSCLNHKPMSALKELSSKRLWCVTCFARMMQNKALSDSDKSSNRVRKHRSAVREYQNGYTNHQPRF